MPNAFEVRVPILTASLNESRRSHWATNMRRVTKERTGVALILSQKKRPPLPVTVTLTRCSPGQLDGHDNLSGSFKHMVDAVAKWLGVDDADTRVSWSYAQQRCQPERSGTLIRIEPAERARAKERRNGL